MYSTREISNWKYVLSHDRSWTLRWSFTGLITYYVPCPTDGSNGTTYKSKQLESASALIYLFRVMCCDWNDYLIAPYEAFFDCYRLSEHFQTMCQAKGTSCSKMIVFKHLLADPTVIVTCMMQILKQYRMFFNMVDLNTHHFEQLAQLMIDHPQIHSDVVALPECVRSLKGLNRRLVTC